MTKYAALLRGINVGAGGGRRVPMADLRSLMEGLGHKDVQTYLQSGQAVFTAENGDEESLAAGLAQALEERFGRTFDVIVRDHAYLRAIGEACPFPAAELEGRQLHVTFFATSPEPDRFAEIDRADYLPEDFRLGDRALYLYAPDGLGSSALAVRLARPTLLKGLITTSRNWNTVKKLIDLTRP
ncbi:uncharacterized protein (DUF1697 family) [Actinocorallia herbida]|uniref:Uncharacterized protein (DUF1697 family) n=1 Tax=Actinocorallia herbida TaxID=58109 RepID=A0A3N1D110_9ACTN|nr:DUF1697 domain-containing protein [Actinocorallia herbida]ROO87190.1 uncharacterized protein (DUF1697 family) [Actinocorallia herbida]